MKWYFKAIKNFANVNGRATRQEYWMFALISYIISGLLVIIDSSLLGSTLGFGWLGSIYSLFVLIPSIALGVRRLHDIDKSGWWLLIALIPIVGAIWLIILFATKSNNDRNKYTIDTIVE